MKTTIVLSILFAGMASAEFEKWTNKEGRTTDLDLIEVADRDGEMAGIFKMRSGKIVTLKTSGLSAEASVRLKAWQPPTPSSPVEESKPGAFDRILSGNLVKLEGKSLKKFEQAKAPGRFYVFYYTASWCGPCQAFTPTLVDFYKKHKNENFELVLISSDQDEDSMERYAIEKKMPWPQLKLRKTPDFKQKYQHGDTGIPSLIVFDVNGDLLGNYRSKLEDLAELVK